MSKQYLKNFNKGVITALVTPLTKDLNIKCEVIKDLIEFQIKNDIKGFFILGTYGEGIALHPNKRKLFTEKFIEYVPSNIPIIVNVTTPSIELTLELARHAADVGANAISSLPPLYYKPDLKGLIMYFSQLSKIDIPIFVYNNPPKQGYDISLTVFERIFSEVNNIVGVKDSSGVPERIQLLVKKFKDKYFIAAAKDSIVLQAFLFGADAHICGLSNAFPELATAIYKAVINGRIDLAVKLQSLLTTIREILKSFGLESSALVKEVMKLRGIDVGYPAPPNRPLDEDELIKLRNKLTPILNEVENLLKKT